MIVQNKKTGIMSYLTADEYDQLQAKGMAKRFTLMTEDLPPIPTAPIPEELRVCCSGMPCVTEETTDVRAIEEPITIQDIEGETPRPKRVKRNYTIDD